MHYLIQVAWGIGILAAMLIVFEYAPRLLSWVYDRFKPS